MELAAPSACPPRGQSKMIRGLGAEFESAKWGNIGLFVAEDSHVGRLTGLAWLVEAEKRKSGKAGKDGRRTIAAIKEIE
jgi:hypothetical protein